MSDTSLRSPWPVELAPPAIERWRDGNTGVPFFTRLDSGTDGPNVMITALVHGNELCGALALDRLLRDGVRPTRGSLTVGFCNVAAFFAFDPDYPSLSRFVDEDFNRLWDTATLNGGRTSVELARAREIRRLVEQADMLLDIHSMQHPTEPLMLAGATDKGLDLARRTGAPATIVIDAGHAAGARLRDYEFFADPSDPRAALLVECGQHWARSTEAVATDTLFRFLLANGTIEAATADRYLTGPAPRQRVLQVTEAITVRTDRFGFVQPFVGMEEIATAGTVIGHDGDEPLATPYDRCILIMPSRRLAAGQTAVRLARMVDD
ncbi:MAG: succinylglutamate desuccinylase/aspartoacylase family protein [Alphaproteobacteria bacterium]|nr:succinylglutamate desuccinylase/aspartoacylase family protein [Alphaproteobacteria bacterium]